MAATILRLLTLAALLLMPFGMQTASATPVHHASAAATAAGHCDEQGGQPAGRSPDQAVDCAMACSMLAAAEIRAGDAVPIRGLPLQRPLADPGAGLHPDTATPPPKLS
ncbi:MAG TPA: hypothetical protein VFU20_07485 [Sphingomicrobium sp.]|nr:hypothetical protein [Sphingomicrobium sp.]